MHTMRNKLLNSALAMMLAAIGFTAFAGGDGDASCGLVAWWKSLGDLNGNGYVDAAEVYDAVNYSTAETPSTATEVGHMTADGSKSWEKARPITHSNVTFFTSLGIKSVDTPVFAFDPPTGTTDTSAFACNMQTITLPCNNLNLTGPFTFVTRFYTQPRICQTSGTSGSWIRTPIWSYDFNFGGRFGIAMNLASQGAQNWSKIQVELCDNSTKSSTQSYDRNRNDYQLPVKDANGTLIIGNVGINQWYDVGVAVIPDEPSVGKTTVRIYARRADLQSVTQDASTRKYFSLTTQAQTNVCDYALNFATKEPTERKIMLGNENGTSTSGYSTDVDVIAHQFRGLVQFLKVYNRALSVEEFESSLIDRTEPVFSVGSRNGASGEFSDAAAESVYDVETMPWYKCRRTLTKAHPSVTIRGYLDAGDWTAGIARVLELSPLGEGGFASGEVEIGVNGTSIGRKTLSAGKDTLLYISASKMKALTASTAPVGGRYPIDVTITRTGTFDDALSFDQVSLTGGWQIGLNDGSRNEFAYWSNPYSGMWLYTFCKYYAASCDTKLLADQFYKVSEKNRFQLQFFLKDAVAANCAFKYTMRDVSPYGGAICSFYVNGSPLALSQKIGKNSYLTIDIPKGTLVPGPNDITVVYNNTPGTSGGDHCEFDFIRLEPVKKWHDSGTLVIIR